MHDLIMSLSVSLNYPPEAIVKLLVQLGTMIGFGFIMSIVGTVGHFRYNNERCFSKGFYFSIIKAWSIILLFTFACFTIFVKAY